AIPLSRSQIRLMPSTAVAKADRTRPTAVRTLSNAGRIPEFHKREITVRRLSHALPATDRSRVNAGPRVRARKSRIAEKTRLMIDHARSICERMLFQTGLMMLL